MLNIISRSIERFWYEGDTRINLLFLRWLWCLIVLIDIFRLWIPSFDLIFLSGAPFRTSEFFHSAKFWNILKYLETDFQLKFFLLVLVICLLVAMSGRLNRLSMIICVFLMICFHNLAPGIFLANHRTLRYVGIILLFSPYPARLDDIKKSKILPSGQIVLRLVQLEFASIWLISFISKIVEKNWLTGEAVLHVFQMKDYTTSILKYLMNNYLPPIIFFQGLTWIILLIEGTIWWALFFRKTRKIALTLGLVMHFGFFLFINTNSFQAVMFMGLLSFVEWDKVYEKCLTQFAHLKLP